MNFLPEIFPRLYPIVRMPFGGFSTCLSWTYRIVRSGHCLNSDQPCGPLRPLVSAFSLERPPSETHLPLNTKHLSFGYFNWSWYFLNTHSKSVDCLWPYLQVRKKWSEATQQDFKCWSVFLIDDQSLLICQPVQSSNLLPKKPCPGNHAIHSLFVRQERTFTNFESCQSEDNEIEVTQKCFGGYLLFERKTCTEFVSKSSKSKRKLEVSNLLPPKPKFLRFLN